MPTLPGLGIEIHSNHEVEDRLVSLVHERYQRLLQGNEWCPSRFIMQAAVESSDAQLVDRLLAAVARSTAELICELVPAIRLRADETTDLSKVEFDVLERIWTAVGAEMSRRGAPTVG